MRYALFTTTTTPKHTHSHHQPKSPLLPHYFHNSRWLRSQYSLPLYPVLDSPSCKSWNPARQAQTFNSPSLHSTLLLALLTYSPTLNPSGATYNHRITSPPSSSSITELRAELLAIPPSCCLRNTAASQSPQTHHDTKEPLLATLPLLSVHAPVLHRAPSSLRVRPRFDAPITARRFPKSFRCRQTQ